VWKLLGSVVLGCGLSVVASGAPVHVVFSGTVTDINTGNATIPLDPSVQLGARFTGSLLYDDESPLVSFTPESPGMEGLEPETSEYDLLPSGVVSLQLGTYSFVNDPTSYLSLVAQQIVSVPDGGSGVTVGWQSPTTGPFSFTSSQIDLFGLGVLHGTALQGIPWNLTDFTGGSWNAGLAEDPDGLHSTLVAGSLDFVALPEPVGLVPFLLAALPAILGGFRRALS
jgi:hypothetical protein